MLQVYKATGENQKDTNVSQELTHTQKKPSTTTELHVARPTAKTKLTVELIFIRMTVHRTLCFPGPS